MGSLDLFPHLETLETGLILLLVHLSSIYHELGSVLPESIKTLKLHVKNPTDGVRNFYFLREFQGSLKNFQNLADI